MSVGDNTIATWCAELGEFENQIEALQTAKRDFYARVREEHGKPLAASLKLAVKLSRTDDEKLRAADEIDAEAWRIVGIIAKSRAPRATRARENIEEFDQETGEFIEAGNPVSDQSTAGANAPPAASHLQVEQSGVGHEIEDRWAVDTRDGAPASEAEPTQVEASSVPRKRQWKHSDPAHPDCLRPELCGGHSNIAVCQACREAATLGQVA